MAKSRKKPGTATAPKKFVAEVQEFIQKKNLGWEAGETSLSNLSPEESAKYTGFAVSEEELKLTGAKWHANEAFYSHAVGAPFLQPSIDWRNVNGANYVGTSKNQGSCLSCAAFAVIGAVEANQRIASKNPNLDLNYSESHLFWCGGGRCAIGWYSDKALEFAKVQGLVQETEVKYEPVDRVCPGPRPNPYRIKDWRRIDTNAGVKQALVNIGPVVWGMRVFQDFYQYLGGVYRYAKGAFSGNHAILVVGYDDGQSCWICKNSWGPDWGKNEGSASFFRIAYEDVSLRNGAKYAFDAYSVEVEVSETTSCQQFVPELTQTIQVARQNLTLKSYLQFWVCGLGSQPAFEPSMHQVATNVRAVIDHCPEAFRVWFCQNLLS